MGTFFFSFAMSFAAALLLITGVGHAVRPRQFVQVIRRHGLFKSLRVAPMIAMTVCGFELLAGVAAALLVFRDATFAERATVLLATACGGLAFYVYLRWLISQSTGTIPCGCSPLQAPLTRASLAPSLGLIGVSVIGVGAAALIALNGSSSADGVKTAIPALWGVTFSGLTIMYPALVVH
jgi:hypothetical protein